MNPNRQPAGIPNGGQFAPGAHPESSVELELGHEDAPAQIDPERVRRSDEHEAVRRLIDEHFGGDAAQAVLAVARAGGVAVAYQDRDCFESALERPLSDDEWARLRPELEDYDEWVDTSDIAFEWRKDALERAGLTYGDDDETCDECGAPVSGFGLSDEHDDSCSLHPDNAAGQ